jgi:hypothetical protein
MSVAWAHTLATTPPFAGIQFERPQHVWDRPLCHNPPSHGCWGSPRTSGNTCCRHRAAHPLTPTVCPRTWWATAWLESSVSSTPTSGLSSRDRCPHPPEFLGNTPTLRGPLTHDGFPPADAARWRHLHLSPHRLWEGDTGEALTLTLMLTLKPSPCLSPGGCWLSCTSGSSS